MSHEYIEMPMPVIIEKPMPVIIEKFRADHKDDYSMGEILEEVDCERSNALIDAARQIKEANSPNLTINDLNESELEDLPSSDWFDDEMHVHSVFGYEYAGNFWVCNLTAKRYWDDNDIDSLLNYYELELRLLCNAVARKDLLAAGRRTLEELVVQKDYVNDFDDRLSSDIAETQVEDLIVRLAFLRDAYKVFYKACARVSGAYIDSALIMMEARRV